MAFDKEQPKVPASIGDITIYMRDHSGTTPSQAWFDLYVLDESGNVFKKVEGDLIPHMTAAQRTWLINFVAQLRDKAVEEIL